jgi:hypothetical protein
MATRMQQRRGTALQWTTANPVLGAGEIGFESDSGKFKIGDGTNTWSNLDYFLTIDELGGSLDDFIPLTQRAAANGVATLDGTGNIPVNQLGNLIDGSPETLNTLNELAAAINDDAGFFTTTQSNINAIAEDVADQGEAIADQAETLTAYDTRIGDVETASTSNGTDISTLQTRATDIETELGDLEEEVSTLSGTVSSNYTTLDGNLTTHNSDTTDVHGIADTAALATKTGTETLTNKTISAADNTVTINAADIIDVTSSAAELNILDGATLSTTELNYVDGVTSAIQTQLNAKAPLADPTFTGTTTTAALTITGNLTVGGTTTTVNATDLAISDPLIYMSSGAWTTDIVDVGFLAATGEVGGTEASHKHSGLIRDVSDNKKWKLLSNVPHPVSNVVDLTGATYDTLRLGGVEFADGVQVKQGVPSLTNIVQHSGPGEYTPGLTDRDKLIEVGSASTRIVRIPTNSNVAFPVGTSFDVLQTGSGQVVIDVEDGVTVNATPGLKLRTQWSSATLFKRAENTWVVYGDLSA